MEKEWKKEKLFRVAPDFVLLLSPHDWHGCHRSKTHRLWYSVLSRSTPTSRLASTQFPQHQALLATIAAGDDALNPWFSSSAHRLYAYYFFLPASPTLAAADVLVIPVH